MFEGNKSALLPFRVVISRATPLKMFKDFEVLNVFLMMEEIYKKKLKLKLHLFIFFFLQIVVTQE